MAVARIEAIAHQGFRDRTFNLLASGELMFHLVSPKIALHAKRLSSTFAGFWSAGIPHRFRFSIRHRIFEALRVPSDFPKIRRTRESQAAMTFPTKVMWGQTKSRRASIGWNFHMCAALSMTTRGRQTEND